MTQRVGQNQNYKVYARLKPVESNTKMLELSYENQPTVSIRDPGAKHYNKYQVPLTQVYDQDASQETIWAHICEPCVTKVLEGHNSCIITYGQTGSGKSYTSFGEDERYTVNYSKKDTINKDRRGLVPRALECLFQKSEELSDIREFVITISFIEIYVDAVRDLGKAYQEQTEFSSQQYQFGDSHNPTYEKQDMQIQENTNGQVFVKDLTQIQIKTMEELYDFLEAAFKLRDKHDNKNNQIWARSHSIFTCSIVQKDRENNDLPFMNSLLQFVDCAGSERIAKLISENHKFQPTIVIHNSLNTLGKCLLNIAKSNKTIPYKESKLTKVLQNTLAISSNVVLIGCLNGLDTNYEECLSTLQFCEKSKNINQSKSSGDQGAAGQPAQDDTYLINYQAQDKQIARSQKELEEAKARIDFMQKDHKIRLEEIREALGIEIDLERITSKANSKDLKQFRDQKEALVKLSTVSADLRAAEKKIELLIKDKKDVEKEH